MSLETEMEDGEQVKRFLADPIISRVLEDIDKQMFAEFKEKKNNDDLRQCWAVSQALKQIRQKLDQIIANGDRAKHDLTERQKKEERERNHVSRFNK